MKFGLTESQYRYIREVVVEPVRSLGASVWCYGSRSRGDHAPFSDLDLMIVSDKDLSKVVCEISETLSKSNFPFKVDLVELSTFAASYKVNFEKDKALF